MKPGFQSATFKRKHKVLRYISEKGKNNYTFTMKLVILQARQSNLCYDQSVEGLYNAQKKDALDVFPKYKLFLTVTISLQCIGKLNRDLTEEKADLPF